jgi:triosephosphate isomerase
MHGLSSDLDEIRSIAADSNEFPQVDVALCVPAILVDRAARAVPGFSIGGQDIHHAEEGAHTGCTSALMLIDAGASLTIVGHSERRGAQRESDQDVKAKAQAALSVGPAILCVGEALEVRERGDAVGSHGPARWLPSRAGRHSGAGDRL